MFEISKFNHILYFFITTTLGTSNLKKFVEDGSVMENRKQDAIARKKIKIDG